MVAQTPKYSATLNQIVVACSHESHMVCRTLYTCLNLLFVTNFFLSLDITARGLQLRIFYTMEMTSMLHGSRFQSRFYFQLRKFRVQMEFMAMVPPELK